MNDRNQWKHKFGAILTGAALDDATFRKICVLKAFIFYLRWLERSSRFIYTFKSEN